MDAAVERLIDRVRAAGADCTALRIRGTGSKDFYGEPPQGELLETGDWTGITSYEPSELVVTVRAGTPLAELEHVLARQRQSLPFEPPRFTELSNGVLGGTVGGMVAAGLSGPSRPSVGSVRDHVLGARLINGRGELLKFGGTVIKNVAGYDVSRVLAGSLGTLGLLTEVSLKVLPVHSAEATLKFECSQASALHLLSGWGGQALPLSASRWTAEAGGTLRLRLRGATAAVHAACERLGGERVDDDLARADWQACRDQQLPWFLLEHNSHALWRVSVPQTAPVLAIDGEPLVEWHGAQRWYRGPVDAAAFIRAAARAVGGHATLFRAASEVVGTSRFDAISKPLMTVHRALKREFDPHNIFNRGRLYPEL
jgi:glycolate oxidase FAD binding subunit